MKVGTDGVLLGAWANCNNSLRALDAGSGTGLIAIMLAQRSKAHIHALEIDALAAQEAKLNVSNSQWSNQITVEQVAFQDFAKSTQLKFDLIVSNPPYFVNSLKSPKANRSLARHTDSLSFLDLLAGVEQCLSLDGLFAVVLPHSAGSEFVEMALNYRLFCVRRTNVKPKPEKPPKRVLLEFSFEEKPLQISSFAVETNVRHAYTSAYKELTKDFYLAF